MDGRKVYEGDELLYKLRFTNASAVPAGITITDAIPQYTSYVEGSANGGAIYDNGVLTWNIENIPAWATVTVSFKVTVNEDVGAVMIQNQATATDGVNDYESQWVFNYTVEDVVAKTVAKTSAPETFIDGAKVAADDELIYPISYKNTAREKSTVTITDTIPAYTAYIANSATEDGEYSDGVITWTLEAEAGQEITVSFKVKVKEVDGTSITNTATVTEGKNTYETNGVTNTTEKPRPSTPTTGDDSNMQLWFGLMFVSCLGLATLALTGKKKEEIQKA